MNSAQRFPRRCAVYNFRISDVDTANSVEHKYARIERERRYLLNALPSDINVLCYRDIADRYLPDTRLRLRETTSSSGERIWKLTQKYPAMHGAPTKTIITNIYLSAAEFTALSGLPGRRISKRRFSYISAGRRYAIDVFRDRLEGLILAETECETDAEVADLPFPVFALRDVSEDTHFTGDSLSQTTMAELGALTGSSDASVLG
jgi:CYTH domain-containing protein